MNIRDFEYLVAIDELKNFTRASEKVFVSQPALTMQVKKVESLLGFKIFERKGKNIITTSKGLEVIKYAKEILLLNQKIKLLSSSDENLRIALIPTICSYLLPHIVEPLNNDLKQKKFFFLEYKSKELLGKLENGEIDFGIISYMENLISDKFEYQNLFEERFLLTLPANSDLTINDFSKILKEKQLILLEEGNCMSDNIKDICNNYKQNSFNDFYATNVETIKNMIKVHNGLALLPELACEADEKLKFLEFEEKKSRQVVLVYRKSFNNTQLINNIARIIQEKMKLVLI